MYTKSNSVMTGVFFIIAAVAAMIGLGLYAPVLNNPYYLTQGAEYADQIVLGVFFELLLACTAVGTGVMLYPYLKRYNESAGLAYVCFRILEVVFILIGLVSVLAMLTLSSVYVNTKSPDLSNFLIIGAVFKGVHHWAFILGPNFMLGINTFIYSYVFYQSKMIPSRLSILGIIAAVFILVASGLEMFGVILQISVPGIMLAIPVFVYEMSLAMWLIIKGINID